MRKWNRRKHIPITLMLALALVLVFTGTAQSQTFSVLQVFSGPPDSWGPVATPVISSGNLTGATNGNGLIFRLNMKTEQDTILYTFTGLQIGSVAGMTAGGSNIYGTTESGGVNGAGSIFELDSSGTLTVLHSFNGSDGATPMGSVIRDSQGNLYGTTEYGGAFSAGSVFKLDPAGNLTTLHSFANGAAGGFPTSGLLLIDDGLYGATPGGGRYGMGMVFRVDISTGAMTVLYNFRGRQDGGVPYSGLISDSQGNLYGTTAQGGTSTCCGGSGVVFKLNPATHQETALHTFSGADGSHPYAGLAHDGAGNLYGTTVYGGSAWSAAGALGYGTVFKLDPSGNLTTLYSFTNTGDGSYPYAGVALDGHGNVYGYVSESLGGRVFEISPAP